MQISDELKYCQDIIDRLIFSNMQLCDDRLYSLYINFGVNRIIFEGNEKSTLAEACKYFKEQIALLTKSGKY